MLKNFRVYQNSVRFYHQCSALRLPRHLKEQLLRASSSISLNLAEGYGKKTFQDKKKYYQIAFGSLRECQAVLDLARLQNKDLYQLTDHLAAQLYKLCTWSP